VRPGFEAAWLRFVREGYAALTGEAPADAPYMSIADEVKARAAEYADRLATTAPDGDLIDSWSEFVPLGALDVVRGEPLT
jgi:hypothetical protein